ncbi:MAG: NADH-quinone oxidoreductase subunit J [Thermoguttaceae bacterium]
MAAIHWDSFFFLFFALVTCVFAVAVVVSNNIVRMAAYLVGSLCGVAGLFFLSGAQFLGAMQLMLYVGGTVVLLIFGVMLTARGPFVSMQSGGGQWILALLAGGSLLAVLLQTVGQVRPMAEPKPAAVESAAANPTTAQLGAGLVGIRTDNLNPSANDARKPDAHAAYLLPFEIISVHLLVVLVGAAFLARAKRRVGAREQGLELSDERLGTRDEESDIRNLRSEI